MTTNTNNNTNKYEFNNLHYDPTNLAFLDPLGNLFQKLHYPWPGTRIQQAL